LQLLAIAPLWQRACALQPIQNRSASLPQQVLQSFPMKSAVSAARPGRRFHQGAYNRSAVGVLVERKSRETKR